MRVRLGTRGSALALWQARHVAELLAAAHPGLEVDVVVLKTEGDRAPDARFTAAWGRGVFVKEIEDALRGGTVDLGVHSLKDLPTEPAQGIAMAATLKRADPRDALVMPHGASIEACPPGAVLATGSPRRRGQLLAARPDLRFVDVRGNVDTRIRKLLAGEFDALVLAAAGLSRLSVDRALWAEIPIAVCLPAPGQGAIAVEARSEDDRSGALAAALDDPDTAAATLAERAFLGALGAGCLAPAGALAVVTAGRLTIEAVVASPDGATVVRDRASGAPEDAASAGLAVAEQILAAGGDAIVRACR